MKVNVVTPWYPDYASAYSGIFVKQQVDALRKAGIDVSVEVPQIFPAPAGEIPTRVTAAMKHLADLNPENIYFSVEEARWIPSPVPSHSGYVGRSDAFAASILAKRHYFPVDADVTHAHLGMPTASALSELGDAPLVVTEHQSTLGRILGNPGSAERYRTTIESADAFFCVSNTLRSQIVQTFGNEVGDLVSILPNIVDLSNIKFTRRSDNAFNRWIYIGTVAAHKGAELLLRSFSAFSRDHDHTATLTIVGGGPHLPWVERYASAHGLTPQLHLAGPQPHESIGSYLDEANTLVHLSPRETFGISSLEGIGAGLPIISLRNGGAESAWGDFEKQCGVLIEEKAAPVEVSNHIAALRDDPSELNPDVARRMVLERYGPSTIVNKLIETYERVMA